MRALTRRNFSSCGRSCWKRRCPSTSSWRRQRPAPLGKPREAEAVYHQARARHEKLAADFPSVPDYRLALAGSRNGLGMLLADLGKGPEAEAAYRQALAFQVKLVAEFPNVPS